MGKAFQAEECWENMASQGASLLRAEYSGGKKEAEMLHMALEILFLFLLPKDSDCLLRALAKGENQT